MANLAISDLHPTELENEIIALTDGEQVSIEGGGKLSTAWKIAKKVGKYGNAAVNAAYVASGAKKIHDTKGKWYSFL